MHEDPKYTPILDASRIRYRPSEQELERVRLLGKELKEKLLKAVYSERIPGGERAEFFPYMKQPMPDSLKPFQPINEGSRYHTLPKHMKSRLRKYRLSQYAHRASLRQLWNYKEELESFDQNGAVLRSLEEKYPETTATVDAVAVQDSAAARDWEDNLD